MNVRYSFSLMDIFSSQCSVPSHAGTVGHRFLPYTFLLRWQRAATCLRSPGRREYGIGQVQAIGPFFRVLKPTGNGGQHPEIVDEDQQQHRQRTENINGCDAGKRGGFMQEKVAAILMASPAARKNPILRGVYFQRKNICLFRNIA